MNVLYYLNRAHVNHKNAESVASLKHALSRLFDTRVFACYIQRTISRL